MLLDQIDSLTLQIERLTNRIEDLLAAIPAACAPAGPDEPGPGGEISALPALPALDRLDEIPGIARRGAQVILAADRR